MEIIIASNNEGKIKEIKELFKNINVKLLYMKDCKSIPDIVESGESFLENAIIKASTVYKKTKKPALGEDSGLIVEALNGEPGVRSARYGATNDKQKLSSKDINKLILKKMSGKKNRKAYYEASIVLIIDNDTTIISEGKCYGEIAREPKGENGFGFDEIFYLPQFKKTAAEICDKEKNSISHRGIALRKLQEKLIAHLKKK